MAREDPRAGSEEELDAASDEALAGRAQHGDRRALERLVRRYVRPVRAVAASYLWEPADVEDAGQETFLRALRAIESYDTRRPFAPWLYQIARNVARNRVAAGKRWQAEDPPAELPTKAPGPDVVLERSEIRALMGAALARLPEQQRTAFRLADVEGYTAVETASIMGLSPGTVRSHIHRARKALRAVLAPSREEVKNAEGA